MEKLAIFGFGGHAKEVALFINKPLIFFTDKGCENSRSIKDFNPDEYKIMVAIGDSKQRESVIESLPENTRFFSFIHPTSIISGKVNIGEGTYIGPYCILTHNIDIGKHSILNRTVQIGHDCRIGEYFSAMPGVIVSGNVDIGRSVYIGTNSSVKEKTFISQDVIIGMQSGVIKHITEPGIYVGSPCKKIKNESYDNQ